MPTAADPVMRVCEAAPGSKLAVILIPAEKASPAEAFLTWNSTICEVRESQLRATFEADLFLAQEFACLVMNEMNSRAGRTIYRAIAVLLRVG